MTDDELRQQITAINQLAMQLAAMIALINAALPPSIQPDQPALRFNVVRNGQYIGVI